MKFVRFARTFCRNVGTSGANLCKLFPNLCIRHSKVGQETSKLGGANMNHFDRNGAQITDPQKIASEFNKYFVNVPKQVDKGIPFIRKSSVDRVDNSFFLSPTDPNEIEAIILSFNNHKSVGPYSVSIKLLKSLSKPAFESLTLIVNDSFNKGIYPKKPKTAKVVALHKKEPVIFPQIIDPYLYYQFLAE